LIKHAADQYGALYIADEVQSGAGRQEKMWAVEYSGVTPDMLTWVKAWAVMYRWLELLSLLI